MIQLPAHLRHFNLPKAGGVFDHSHPLQHLAITHHGNALRDGRSPQHAREDLELLHLGILDEQGYITSREEHQDNVRVALHHKSGELHTLRYSHNLKMNNAALWILELMLGGLNLGATQAATASSATTLTSATTTAPTASQYVGHYLVATVNSTTSVWGKIVSHTTTTTPVYTVDAWYAAGGFATGSTPSATATYMIMPGRGVAPWIAYTTTASFAPNTTDVQGSGWAAEVTTSGLARAAGTYSAVGTLPPTGSSTSLNQQGQAKLHQALTLSGTVTGVDGVGLFEYAGQGNGNPMFEAAFTLFSGASGDSVTTDQRSVPFDA